MWRTTVLLLLALCSLVLARYQSVRVEGVLTCEGKPYQGAKVKLYDHDTFTIDDKLAETETDGRGHFVLAGTGNELTRLNAQFNIYHRCRKTVPVCYYKATFPVPFSYVTSGQSADKTYDAQTIELSLLKKHRDCIN